MGILSLRVLPYILLTSNDSPTTPVKTFLSDFASKYGQLGDRRAAGLGFERPGAGRRER